MREPIASRYFTVDVTHAHFCSRGGGGGPFLLGSSPMRIEEKKWGENPKSQEIIAQCWRHQYSIGWYRTRTHIFIYTHKRRAERKVGLCEAARAGTQEHLLTQAVRAVDYQSTRSHVLCSSWGVYIVSDRSSIYSVFGGCVYRNYLGNIGRKSQPNRFVGTERERRGKKYHRDDDVGRREGKEKRLHRRGAIMQHAFPIV